MGYQQNFLKAVVHSSKYAGGIDLAHLQAKQLSAKVTSVMKQVRAQTKIGTQFIIMVRWAQMCTGTSIPILEDPQLLPHLEGKWLKTVIEDLQEIKGKSTFTTCG
eukprot:15339039-Ditylum_brightwellii.AAC.1